MLKQIFFSSSKIIVLLLLFLWHMSRIPYASPQFSFITTLKFSKLTMSENCRIPGSSCTSMLHPLHTNLNNFTPLREQTLALHTENGSLPTEKQRTSVELCTLSLHASLGISIWFMSLLADTTMKPRLFKSYCH